MTEHNRELLTKVMRLKGFALTNGYDVEPMILTELNELNQKSLSEEAFDVEDSTRLDKVLAGLTHVTFPVTIDTLSTETESMEYKRFKKYLFATGVIALLLALGGFSLSVAAPANFPVQLSNSLLAISLGLLGAVIYSLFNVLGVIPPQAFNPNDEYSNYARLLLGVLLGWIFYFTFAREAFENLQNLLVTEGLPNTEGLPKTGAEKKDNAFFLLIPFVAGYSTKFVIAVLERVIAALEIAMGIEDKRDVSTKKAKSARGK